MTMCSGQGSSRNPKRSGPPQPRESPVRQGHGYPHPQMRKQARGASKCLDWDHRSRNETQAGSYASQSLVTMLVIVAEVMVMMMIAAVVVMAGWTVTMAGGAVMTFTKYGGGGWRADGEVRESPIPHPHHP